jgi:hypothetical protein
MRLSARAWQQADPGRGVGTLAPGQIAAVTFARSQAGPARAAGPRPGRRRWRAEWLVLGAYLLAAIILTIRLWFDPATQAQVGDPQDVDLYAWFLRYSATAISHGGLPALVSTAMNAPRGIGLMWNTAVLLPGVLLTPVTLLAGPQVSATVMLTLGFAGSAASLFLVLRRWGASVSAAAIGGAVYGFSPALVNSGTGHYQMQFAVLPPLIIDAALRIVTGRGHVVRNGVCLGLLVAAQIFIGEELLLQTVLAGVLLVLALIISRPREVPGRVRGSLAGLATGAAVVLVSCAYPLWVQFRGPLAEHGSPWNTSVFPARPAAFVTPDGGLLFHTGASAAAAASYPNYIPEYLAYLGWPLLIVLVIAAACFWGHLRVRATAVTFILLEVFSLGGSPAALRSHVPAALLPWHWIYHLPFLSQMLPDRFAVLADGAGAALLAFSLDLARSAAPVAVDWRRRALATGVAALAVLPLVPLPLHAAAVTPLPAGWATAFRRLNLARDARVLVVPIPSSATPYALRWQADSGKPGSLIGGYFIGPKLDGHAMAVLSYPVTSPPGYLNALWRDRTPPRGPSPAMVRASLTGWWRPAAVVAVTSQNSRLGRYLISLLGLPPVRIGQILAWRLRT